MNSLTCTDDVDDVDDEETVDLNRKTVNLMNERETTDQ